MIQKIDESVDIYEGGATVKSGSGMKHYRGNAKTFTNVSAFDYLKSKFNDDNRENVSVFASPNDVASGAPGNAVNISYSGEAWVTHVIKGLVYSYERAPYVSGFLKVFDGSTLIFNEILTEAQGSFNFEQGKRNTRGNEMLISLGTAGTGIRGTLNVINHWTE